LEYWASTSFSSMINWGHLLLVLENDTSNTTLFYRLTKVTIRNFAEGASLPYFQYLITSLWLVSWVTEGALRLYFQYNVVLLVSDWYYTHVCRRGVAPLFSSNILLVFDLYTMLLKEPRSHDKKFTSLRLVLHMYDYFDYSSWL
jgi:hypothetical protein